MESKSMKLLLSLKSMAVKAQTPQKDGSHNIDAKELSKLANDLYNAVKHDCKIASKNTRHAAIDKLMECHPLGLNEVQRQIMNIQWKDVSPFENRSK